MKLGNYYNTYTLSLLAHFHHFTPYLHTHKNTLIFIIFTKNTHQKPISFYYIFDDQHGE
ncbi:hypothetical protein HanXRQr2_Chr15g0684541 [Helianthus annuus]|uniref:Uncharacterized protein n=1 Tax=Helianthus annuus TaxID=4232 RepID=A0A251TNG8_HELAN|nr:hypothetical protein HanXRQr2_Chr15g0684541 [Helianthus annuus]KAJ0830518.1 hypothetical protein HanPSC8_Chr15g0656361 [Helianthus annuus]